MRSTREETWLAMAHAAAKRSRCARDQVGAVIVSRDNFVVATGYNGPPAGYPHDGESCIDFCTRAQDGPIPVGYNDCPSLHAEANALLVCDRTSRAGGSIFITSHVCYDCAKLIANSGLSRVVVEALNPDRHRNPTRSYVFLISCGLEVEILERA